MTLSSLLICEVRFALKIDADLEHVVSWKLLTRSVISIALEIHICNEKNLDRGLIVNWDILTWSVIPLALEVHICNEKKLGSGSYRKLGYIDMVRDIP